MSDTENRLVTNLEARARNAKDPGERAEALCLLIIHYARQGHLTNARADLAALRSDPRYAGSAQASAWMELAEGVIANAACDYGLALYRVQLAYSISLEKNLNSVRHSSAAWLADIAFQMSQVQVMVMRLKEVFESTTREDHHSRARAAQTVATSMFYVDDHESAKRWFDLSHGHATAEGDQAAISSLFYNTAAYRLLHLRLKDSFGLLKNPSLNLLLYGENTFRFYDLAINNSIQLGSSTLTRAQIRSLQGQHDEAISLLNQIDLNQLRFSEVPVFLCEKAWANNRMGAINEATHIAKDAHKLIGNMNDQDDLAYVKARLSKVFDDGGESHLSELLCTEADEHFSQLSENFAYWKQQLRSINYSA